MLTILQQPRIEGSAPEGIRRPVVYLIQTDDQTPIPGRNPAFRIRFESTNAVQDSLITIMGMEFTVDNTQGATPTSFDSLGGVQQVANSFADMLRLRFELRNFVITVEPVTGFWEVLAEGFVDEEISPSLWVFNIASVAVDLAATVVTATNGRQATLRDTALWYRVHSVEDGAPMWREQMARFAYKPNTSLQGTCEIDVSAIIWKSIQIPHPDLEISIPRRWPLAMPHWVLKYAQIDIGDNCTQQPGQLYTSEGAQALPVVLQPEDLGDTFRFVFTGFVVRQYMTRRPTVAFACRGVHEFVSFPFVHTGAVNTDLRVTYEVGIWEDAILLDLEQYEFEDAEQGIWELGVGEANLAVQALLTANPTADFWTVKVEMWRKTGSPGYYLAHTLTRRLGDECKCPDLELYYLEDFGSYRTLQLFRLEEQAQEQRAVTGKRDIDWLSGDRNSIFVRRGRSSKTVQANERLTYRTQVLPSKDDAGGIYAELLRCKQAYVKDGMQPTFIRSIAIERIEIVQLVAEEAQVFNITFRYNTDITIRP